MAAAKQSLRRLFFSLSGRLVRFVPNEVKACRHGVFYSLDLREIIDFQTFFRKWEPETYRFLKVFCTPGKTVIEVGANFGIHSMYICKSIGQSGYLWAFEATEYATKKFRKNLSLNPHLESRVELIERLVGHGSVAHNLRVRSSWNSRGQGQLYSDQFFEAVETLSLDDYFKNRTRKIDLIKIDVDGFDWNVLRGSKSLIQDDLPVVFMELSVNALLQNGGSVEQVWGFFSKLNYSCYDSHDPSFQRKYPDVTSVLAELANCSHRNYLFVPNR